MGEEQLDLSSLEIKLIQDAEIRPRSMQHKVVTKVFAFAGLFRPLFTDQVYVHGIEENLLSQGEPVPGPFLWLMKHESWYDILNLPPEFEKLPGTPEYTVMGREHYTYIPPLDLFLNKLFNLKYIKRGWLEKRMDKKKREAIEEFNRKTIKEIQDGFPQGIHAYILPEGTTRNNGAIAKIRSGAYNVSHLVQDGKIYVVNCVPVGNTYDLMSGRKGRPLVFLRPGKPFHYKPLESGGDSGPDYLKADIANFSGEIRRNLAELNTVTLSQILGLRLRVAAEREEPAVRTSDIFDLASLVYDKIERIDHGSPVFVDPELKTASGRNERFLNFYSSLINLGYVIPLGNIAVLRKERILNIPKDDYYKRDNPLGYMTNRILSVFEEMPNLRAAFEQGFRISNLADYRPR